MDSAWVRNDLPTVSGRIALIGSWVSRLIAFCLLYFAPTLAYEQGVYEQGALVAPATATVSAFSEPLAAVPLAAESLDPKHEKDHDQDRESAEHARGHYQPH
jgi:hypothetical protein